jgi:hypothetical protein
LETVHELFIEERILLFINDVLTVLLHIPPAHMILPQVGDEDCLVPNEEVLSEVSVDLEVSHLLQALHLYLLEQVDLIEGVLINDVFELDLVNVVVGIAFPVSYHVDVLMVILLEANLLDVQVVAFLLGLALTQVVSLLQVVIIIVIHELVVLVNAGSLG